MVMSPAGSASVALVLMGVGRNGWPKDGILKSEQEAVWRAPR